MLVVLDIMFFFPLFSSPRILSLSSFLIVAIVREGRGVYIRKKSSEIPVGVVRTHIHIHARGTSERYHT